MNKMVTFPMLALGLSLAACTPRQSAAAPVAAAPAPATTTTTSTAAPAAQAGFQPLAPLSETRRTSFARAEQVIDPSKRYRAVLNTSRGAVTVELNPKAAPVAVNNFVFLALNRFYDGTRFHRVIEGFMAQGGDPLSTDPARREAWGTGGPGYSFMAEHRNGLRFDRAGVLGMARGGSLDSQGSQFFITLAPANFLSGEYTVFGQVVTGQEVLNRLTRNYTSSQPIPGAGADVLNSVQILVAP
ncbi:peptidylprolyl isomerase [Deinococcus deserti]|uniref:Peptidyl-prolyl cis-trans isomerase n=1 Tax=Deinococcus deserti (strain DSM 17065 / CIP 109153 / LMG 22923 / VCD115) TaxID=546414 RepID=C1CX74_DEIDV|nr:peptidylprolyl isomerase [Deinococcus deserti]ACO46791.1 putative Peptidylprolyl isomerase, precursor (Peptidyl-prolyl cis-trans isomerase) (PPIase) [Deinococcus deserti VCD115]